ncbi:putative stationary phase protein [Clavispora lusitaniae]|uniref:Stationary phase protein n=2 Tax=Clavispora lusitaniae TaxID=36911 RepID=C4XW81_CLAL4|nr:uncharacterized protein CLUG_00204 [Clavispora lusitaniae ATCC 42720]KAF7584138.1 hypothetical protein FOB63_000210 [Clavispora lusitaniae]EEQ36081.1 hypothetical protein CLUG_00204 [Clavispora lusitaniae ATCC 42720]QFZ25136.1 putative stationary phase protein [Clavispora lusitaniae]QFZ31561.1 putative stationary phase protein [Clavispora lusitaniae]QFZ37229.1 putative stationary phase protein [Clavispora lusitaniae]
MSTLKNLSALRKKIAKRIREALSELHENLGRGQSAVPVPVPVPMRSPRGFRMCPLSCYSNASFGARRFYCTYSNRFSGFANLRWAKITDSVLFQNFSSRTHFRSRSFANFYKTPTVMQLLKLKPSVEDANGMRAKHRIPTRSATAMEQVPSGLRLNVSLSKRFHDMVMDLAKPVSNVAEGCYVDFQIQPRILIPQNTMMSPEVLSELLVNLKHFEKHIRDLQSDLARLGELGELPVQFLGAQNTIRVYFPNCDRERLETLLREKNVVNGVVYEDYSNECVELESSSSVSSLSDFDILSSFNLSSSASSDSDAYDDVLSSSEGSRLEPASSYHRVEIVDADSYYWT